MKNTGNWKYDIWSEGKYIDLWTINHILAGGLLAGLFLFIKIKLLFGFFISLAVMLAWEVYEIKYDIKETIHNSVMDVLTGLIGFLFMHFVFSAFGKSISVKLFAIMLICWLTLETWGYMAYMKR